MKDIVRARIRSLTHPVIGRSHDWPVDEGWLHRRRESNNSCPITRQHSPQVARQASTRTNPRHRALVDEEFNSPQS